MRGHRGLLASPGLWFAVALSASAAYGVEQWRRGASRAATRHERARMQALVGCMLGGDGHAFARDVGRSRTRLRALAMATSLAPTPTWLDRCIPLADALAREGARVDVTSAPTRASTQIAASATELSRALRRVGFVWQVRAGDPETDMEHLATLLARTSAEVDLADDVVAESLGDTPRAPRPPAMPSLLRVELPGARPLPVGETTRFLVGTPLPMLSRVTLDAHRAEVDVLGNEDARAWRLRPRALIRLLPEDGQADRLAPLRAHDLDGLIGSGRLAAPPPGVPLSAVSLDATRWGDALWVAEAVRGAAPTLARMPTRRGEPITAVRLGEVGSSEDLSHVEVAIGADPRGVYAARTLHQNGSFTVRAVRAGRGVRAAVTAVRVDDAAWRLQGRHPGLAACRSGTRLWLAATSQRRWVVGRFDDDALAPVGDARSSAPRFDEIATLRCSPEGALVYGRDRARRSPVLWCALDAPCITLPPWAPPQPGTLPDWSVVDLRGERRAMPEWPMRFVRSARGAVLAARASGTLVAVTRSDTPGAPWAPEQVVFDAAAHTPRERVEDVELYADANRLLLVIATAQELHLAVSYDDGRSWQRP